MLARALIVVCVVFAAGCGEQAAEPAATPSPTEPEETALESAMADCVDTKKYATLGDEGMSLDLDGENEFGDGVATTEIMCVLEKTDVPDHVVSQMENTRALDGMQDAEWEGWSARWTYHPDAGFDITVVERS